MKKRIKKSRSENVLITKMEKAIELVQEAQEIVDKVMMEIGGQPEAYYFAYGSFGFRQLLGKGNPLDKGLQNIIGDVEKMKFNVYVQFLTLDTKKEVCDLLGTDGVFILDGRNNMNTWIWDAKHQINRLKNVQPDIIGFKIIKSNNFRDNDYCVKEWLDKDRIRHLRLNGGKRNG